MIYVLDAHPIIWHLEQPQRLTPAARTVFNDRSARVVVPTIVLAEIRHAHGRGRVSTSPTEVRAMLGRLVNATVHPFDEAVLERMPDGFEIHDAIIVATTLLYRASTGLPVRLITHDNRITASGLVDALW